MPPDAFFGILELNGVTHTAADSTTTSRQFVEGIIAGVSNQKLVWRLSRLHRGGDVTTHLGEGEGGGDNGVLMGGGGDTAGGGGSDRSHCQDDSQNQTRRHFCSVHNLRLFLEVAVEAWRLQDMREDAMP